MYQIRLDIQVKCRFMGTVLATFADHEFFNVPAELQVVGTLIGAKVFGTYDKHGVTIHVSLVKTVPENAALTPIATT